MKNFTFSFLILLCAIDGKMYAQSTYQEVYNLFQANCTGACHAGSTPSGLMDLSASPATVYNNLVNATPTNPVADSEGLKRVVPGYPYRSFLMKKVNHGLDPQNDVTQAEGVAMPNNSSTLSKEQIELIRQWIIWGAKDTGNVYNENLIHAYYTNGGIPEIAAPATPAQEGREGYQVKFGPIFLQPDSEFEFFQVYNPNLTAAKEVTELFSDVPVQCHHWAIRTVSNAGANAMGAAPLAGNNFNTQILVYQYTKFLGIWQFSDSLKFPQGTAHFQDSAEALLLNLHLHNYSNDSIIAASAYMNVYTQPMGSGAVEMKTDLFSYGGQDPFLLQIPPTGQPFTLLDSLTSPGETRYFWNIQAHTHSRGKAYHMYLRNADGSKGTMIYDGNYNENYTTNQGYYDYSHPAVRTFAPMMKVDMDSGLIFEATWVNSSADTIPFGLTTKQEMFVSYFQYTNELPTTGIQDIAGDKAIIHIFPNPANSVVNITSDASLIGSLVTITDITGRRMVTAQPVSNNMQISTGNFPDGIYLIAINTGAETTTRKLIVGN